MRNLMRDFCDYFRTRRAEQGRMSAALEKFEPWVLKTFQAGDVVILRSREPLCDEELVRVRTILANWHKMTGVQFLHLSCSFEVVGVRPGDDVRQVQI